MALSKIRSDSMDDAAIQSNRNILVNGAATVNQRGNQTIANTLSVYFVDRFNVYTSAASAAANLQQSTDTPSGQGFGNSMLVDVTTADTSVGAGEIIVLRQIIEGQNLQQLKYGTSNAKSVTLSFWAKSPKTGVHLCELYHLATGTSKTQSQSYTVSSANTWEKHSVTFSGDTATTLDNDNAYTIAVQWPLFAGTDYTSGTLQTTWANITNANRLVGQQNFFDSASNNFYLTGVQMEVGEVATPFEHRTYADTLQDCLRYFYRLRKTNAYGEFCTIRTYSGDDGTGIIYLPQPMRVQPTLTIDKTVNSTNFAYSLNSITVMASDVNVTQVGIACASSSGSAFTTGGGATIQSNGGSGAIDVSFDFASEL